MAERESRENVFNLLMQGGGVAAAIKRLVGATQAGHVKVYERVALHVSKVPKLVTTTREYYKAVCPQLPPLFLLLLPGAGGCKEGNSAARIITNMHHVIRASQLAACDPKLCEEFLLRPLLRPLLAWAACISVETNLSLSAEQEGAGSQDGSILVQCTTSQTKSVLPILRSFQAEESTEALLLNALFGMHIFITARPDGSESIRKIVFQLIEPLAHILSSLSFLLEPASTQCGKSDLTRTKRLSASRQAMSVQEVKEKITKGDKTLESKSLQERQPLGRSSANIIQWVMKPDLSIQWIL